jgi:plastocyanin
MREIFFGAGKLVAPIQATESSRRASQKAARVSKEKKGENMKRKQKRSAVLAVVMLAWAAPVLGHDECDDDLKKPAAVGESAKPQPVASVTIKLFQFQPSRIEVRPGSTVTWMNDDEILHTVTTEKKENGFNASLDGKGKSFSRTFSQSGTYSYYCDRHEHMRGEVLVR